MDPAQLFGPLFRDVLEAGIFGDQKTFVDCQPKMPPADILARYQARCETAGLHDFVFEHFFVPETPRLEVFVPEGIDRHLEIVWSLLQCEPPPPHAGSSLLSLIRAMAGNFADPFRHFGRTVWYASAGRRGAPASAARGFPRRCRNKARSGPPGGFHHTQKRSPGCPAAAAPLLPSAE